MKIDFNASYQSIARLLKQPGTAPEAREPKQQFGKLLASIAPDRQEVVEIKEVLADEPSLETQPSSNDNGPMASFKFSEPKLTSPLLERIQDPTPINESVNGTSSSVKTPSILRARRVFDRSQLADLRKEERISEVKTIVTKAGGKYGVDPALGMSVISAESAFNPNAVSSDGHFSKGLFQLLDTTGKETMGKLGLEQSYQPFDPEQNIELGLSHLRYLHNIFSEETELSSRLKTVVAANSSSLEKLAVAAFNAGEGRVASAQERAERAGLNPAVFEEIESYLPESTREYVAKVFDNLEEFEGVFAG